MARCIIIWFINMNGANAALEELSENWLVASILYSTKWLLIIPIIIIKPKWIILNEDTKRVAQKRLWCYLPNHANNAWFLMWIYIRKMCPGGAEPPSHSSLSVWHVGNRYASLDQLLPSDFLPWKIILFIFQSRIKILRTMCM